MHEITTPDLAAKVDGLRLVLADMRQAGATRRDPGMARVQGEFKAAGDELVERYRREGFPR